MQNFEIDIDQIYGLAEKYDEVLELERDLFQFKRLLELDSEVENFFADLNIGKNLKLSALQEIFAEKASVFLALMGFLIELDMVLRTPQISEKYSRVVAQKKDLAFGEVISTEFLNKSVLKQITDLAQKRGRKLILKNTIDPSIMGGLVIQLMGGMVIDASIRGKLNQLRERLIHATN